MSRLKPQKEYEKTFAFHFFRWLSGSKDPYLGEVEMQPQKEIETPESTILERMVLFHKIYVIAAIFFSIVLAGLLLYTVSCLPGTGNASNPANNEVPKRYIEKGLEETGAVNVVTGMILDYRAFDTFGESNVLFIATVTVLILLHRKKKGSGEKEEDDRVFEPKNDVILNGHLSPGGGFSGGAIIGAGLILYLTAFGFEKAEKMFTEKTYKAVCFVALTFYCLAKSYSFFTGANHLDSHIPLGEAGHILSSGLILPLNICVGMVVACTMYTFYVMFRKGDF